MGHVHVDFGFSALLRFRVRSLYRTDRQTDGRTNGQDKYCGLLRRPHNTVSH